MKSLQKIAWLSILLLGMVSASSATAQKHQLSGRVTDSSSNPIAYATVVLLDNSTQIAGGSTNDNGTFSLSATAGNYTLHISYVGYKTIDQAIELKSSTDLGDIVMEVDAERIDEVVVTANIIRREADRFVVDVASSPIALGKDGEELLKSAPGVWIQDDKISINGASGSKIYLNDREVKLDDAQLIAYLRSLSANDIQRIEVIPQSGADYDASSSGGIIKITTRKRLDSGLMGSASLSAHGSKGVYNVMPSVSLNYNRGKLNAYGRAWAGLSGNNYISTEHTDYTSGTIIDAASDMDDDSQWGGANVGVVYDINDKHSLGAEVQYNYYGGGSINNTWTEHTLADITTRTDGHYKSHGDNHMTTATLNYIYKLDDKGSVLKFIGDYAYSNSPDRNNYFDREIDPITLLQRDSTYRDNSLSLNQLGTATVALEKVLSPKVTLKAGVKYTYNNNSNTADYEYLNGEAWMPNTDKSYDIGYTENIGAAYVIASAKLGRVSLVGGLRGEYTNFRDKAGAIAQNYFDLFPNANVSFALTKDYAYSLIAQYARTISRPSFWALSPNETKISEYMIQRGNPNLKPSYDNSVSVTAVLKYKYTITVGMMLMENAIQQSTIADKDNPELLIIQYMNYPTLNNYYASVNLPMQITKWWAANINLTGLYMGQRIRPEEAIRRNFMATANAQMSFTLPRNYFVELDGMYMHGAVAGNTKLNDMGNINLTLKKRLLENKLTVSLGVQNIVSTKQEITIKEAEFERKMYMDQPWQRPAVRFQISYNFNSGKQFRAKSVESGSAEDRGRIGSGGNSGQ
mgnify:CR=1 FL=1